MITCQRTQRGASRITLIIILAIIGAGAYIGLQYIPQHIEAGTVNAILANLEKIHNATHISSTKALSDMIDKQLNMNGLDDMKDSFKVTQDGAGYIVKVRFERELDLIYEKKPVIYENTLTLR